MGPSCQWAIVSSEWGEGKGTTVCRVVLSNESCQMNQTNQSNEIDQRDEIDQTDQMNQTNQTDQIDQIPRVLCQDARRYWVQSRVCNWIFDFIASKSVSQWINVAWCFIAIMAIRQSAAEGEIPCLLREPAKSQALSHHSGLKGSRGTGLNHWRRPDGCSDLTSPVMSSRRIHSVTAVCPLTIKGLSLAWISAFPVGRRAWIQTEVSTRYMERSFVSLGTELARRQIERNAAQRISQFL